MELSEAIEALRAELAESMRLGMGQRMRFAIQPLELTLEAVVTKDANGKVGWKILEASGGFESVRTQTVKLQLTPVWTKLDGTPTYDFTIADVEDTGDAQTFG